MSTFNAKAKAEYGGLLPPFDFTQRVEPFRGLQDKVEMVFELGAVSGSQIPLFVHYLGLPPKTERDGSREGFGQVFNRQQGRGSRCKNMPVRKVAVTLDGERLPPPVFRGALQFWPSSACVQILKAKLSLNPTTYLRRRGFPHLSQLLVGNYIRRFRRDLPVQPANFRDREFPFAPRDNWLPNTRGWRLATTEPAWERLLRSYVAGVHRAVESDIERTAGLTDVTISPPDRNRFVVRRVETYWEFFSHDPLADIGRLAPLLKETFAAHSKDYPVDDDSRELKFTPTFAYSTRGGEWLKIYAKTNRRIRVEVTHFLSGEDRFQKISRYSFNEIDGVLDLFRTLAEHAAEQVNKFFSILERKTDFRHHKSLMQLLSDIALACNGNAEKAQMILNLLVFHTGIDRGRGTTIPAHLKGELQRLVQNGVLDSAKRFSISGPYSTSLEFLRELESKCVLNGRIRRRRSPFVPE